MEKSHISKSAVLYYRENACGGFIFPIIIPILIMQTSYGPVLDLVFMQWDKKDLKGVL